MLFLVAYSPSGDYVDLITCNLTKLETALEQVRKTYPKLNPTDAALVASALSLVGRHAIAVYEGEQYIWPEDYARLTEAMSKQMEMVQQGIDATAPKKVSKTAPEEEPISVSVGLMPNLSAGEKQLDGFDKLKTLLSDCLQEGVEFTYQTGDLMWQWALDRANWSTIAGRDISRRVKVKASFTEGAVGIEMGLGGTKKRVKAVKVVATVEPEAEVEAEVESEADAEAVE